MNQGTKKDNPGGATNIPVPESTHSTCRCGAWRGAYGLEPTVKMYVAHTVEILGEIRRVLRKDGVVFWNIGDSYWGQAAKGGSGVGGKEFAYHGDTVYDRRYRGAAMKDNTKLKPKDLCLIPARVALAAQADGWWVRSLIIWAKPNPMPESVTDRPTDAYEHIIMLTKSERYYWHAEAVLELADLNNVRKSALRGDKNLERQSNGDFSESSFSGGYTGYRNMRNVWEFPTQPFSGAHFAVFPEEIPRRAILAATSSRGACAKCGAPWTRITKSEFTAHDGNTGGVHDSGGNTKRIALLRQAARERGEEYQNRRETIGWESTCKCGTDETVPCLCLDPFGGSGTTGRVAVELNRRAVLLDLAYSEDGYAPLARKRLREVQRNLPL